LASARLDHRRSHLAWREFRYEDLVEDFETVVRGLLAFVGVDWHQAVAGLPGASGAAQRGDAKLPSGHPRDL
jgi:hypothetical protein